MEQLKVIGKLCYNKLTPNYSLLQMKTLDGLLKLKYKMSSVSFFSIILINRAINNITPFCLVPSEAYNSQENFYLICKIALSKKLNVIDLNAIPSSIPALLLLLLVL